MAVKWRIAVIGIILVQSLVEDTLILVNWRTLK